MEIKLFTWDVVDSNSYLIAEENRGILIDAVDSDELITSLLSLDEVIVVLTHSHFDHIVGLNRIRSICKNVKLISTEKCSVNIGNKFRNMSSSATAFMTFYSGMNVEIESFECAPADVTFDGTYSFLWGAHSVNLFAVYGHSDDGLVVLVEDRLFSGDTLLPIPTVTRFPRGNTERFWKEDIPLLRKFNVSEVYPGHGLQGNLADMLAVNDLPKECADS